MSRIVIFLSLLLCSCNNDAEIYELPALLRGTGFEIDAVYYGGIVGQQSMTYEFYERNGSVCVQVFPVALGHNKMWKN
jgi:hypothetical protein